MQYCIVLGRTLNEIEPRGPNGRRIDVASEHHAFFLEVAMPRRARYVLPFVALLSSTSLSGCFLIAAGAGAAGAIAYTNRGASSNMAGSVDATFTRATTAFSALGITETGRSTDNSGATRRLTGKQGDIEVSVEMTRSSDDVTKVEVVARRNTVDYDKDLAKRVLDRMMQG